MDQATGAFLSITVLSTGYQRAHGMDQHPTTFELWAILRVQSSNNFVLSKISPDTGLVIQVHTLPFSFASIAFDENGVLYAVRGFGAGSTFHTIDIITGAVSLINLQFPNAGGK